MNTADAIPILERLAGHWPGMASTDHTADDWIRAIARTGNAHEVADVIVTGWTKDRGPRIADWFQTARDVAVRRALEVESAKRAELEAIVEEVIAPGRVRSLVDMARAALSDARTRRPPERAQPISRYDTMPVHWGEHLMTPEERDEELARFGDRKVRERKLT